MTQQEINRNNTQQLSQFSGEPARLKLLLNNAQIDALPEFGGTSASSAYHRLKPTPFGKGIVLSFNRLPWKCECGHRWVEATQRESVTVWICKQCNTPRLARRQKSDDEMISELLSHPRLTSFERTFTQTHSKKLGTWQRKRIQGFARRLEISLECNCSLSEVEGGEA